MFVTPLNYVTHNTTRLAVEVRGNGFLRVEHKGHVAYTRSTILTVENGQLVAQGENLLPHIEIAANVDKVWIGNDGTVWVWAGDTKTSAGRLNVAKFETDADLTADGTYFKATTSPTIAWPTAEDNTIISLPLDSEATAAVPAVTKEAVISAITGGTPVVPWVGSGIQLGEQKEPKTTLRFEGSAKLIAIAPNGTPIQLTEAHKVPVALTTPTTSEEPNWLLSEGNIGTPRFSKIDYKPRPAENLGLVTPAIFATTEVKPVATTPEATVPVSPVTTSNKPTTSTKTTTTAVKFAGKINVDIDGALEVEGSSILLGEIASISGDEEACKALGTLAVGNSPAPGTHRGIDQGTIWTYLRRSGYDPKQFNIHIAKGTTISRKAQMISGKTLIEKATQESIAQLKISGNYTCNQRVDDLAVPTGDYTLTVDHINKSGATITATVTATQQGKTVGQRTIVLKASADTLAVKAGDTIRIIVKTGSAAIEVKGRSREAGTVGDTITVVTDTGSVHKGIVTATGVVEVTI